MAAFSAGTFLALWSWSSGMNPHELGFVLAPPPELSKALDWTAENVRSAVTSYGDPRLTLKGVAGRAHNSC